MIEEQKTNENDTGKYDIILQAVKIPGHPAGEFRTLEIITSPDLTPKNHEDLGKTTI